MKFRIEYAPPALSHLKALTPRHQRIVLDGVNSYLSVDPMVETRRRKPMRPNPLAPWELRLGNLRVYFRVTEEPKKIVEIAAVGIKRRDQIWIAGERGDF